MNLFFTDFLDIAHFLVKRDELFFSILILSFCIKRSSSTFLTFFYQVLKICKYMLIVLIGTWAPES